MIAPTRRSALIALASLIGTGLLQFPTLAAAAEERAEFIATAEQRLADFVATGKSVPWSDVRQYIQLRAAGKKTAWPKARTFRPS